MSQQTQTPHIDDVAVERFAKEMAAKMKHARENRGRGGWYDPEECSVHKLQHMLREHIAKGDMVDVANFAMMIWCRETLLDHGFYRESMEQMIAYLRANPIPQEKGR